MQLDFRLFAMRARSHEGKRRCIAQPGYPRLLGWTGLRQPSGRGIGSRGLVVGWSLIDAASAIRFMILSANSSSGENGLPSVKTVEIQYFQNSPSTTPMPKSTIMNRLTSKSQYEADELCNARRHDQE